MSALNNELTKWRELHKAIAELNGTDTNWPDHGNAPLAIAAGYALLQNRVRELEAQIATARAEEREKCADLAWEHECKGWHELCDCRSYVAAAIRALKE